MLLQIQQMGIIFHALKFHSFALRLTVISSLFTSKTKSKMIKKGSYNHNSQAEKGQKKKENQQKFPLRRKHVFLAKQHNCYKYTVKQLHNILSALRINI